MNRLDSRSRHSSAVVAAAAAVGVASRGREVVAGREEERRSSGLRGKKEENRGWESEIELERIRRRKNEES